MKIFGIDNSMYCDKKKRIRMFLEKKTWLSPKI